MQNTITALTQLILASNLYKLHTKQCTELNDEASVETLIFNADFDTDVEANLDADTQLALGLDQTLIALPKTEWDIYNPKGRLSTIARHVSNDNITIQHSDHHIIIIAIASGQY